jgi:hypothetical protein
MTIRVVREIEDFPRRSREPIELESDDAISMPRPFSLRMARIGAVSLEGTILDVRYEGESPFPRKRG